MLYKSFNNDIIIANKIAIVSIHMTDVKICLPAKIQPADHISIDVVYSLAPKRTSGGRYLLE